MDTLHNLEETILEGIVDRIESEEEDDEIDYDAPDAPEAEPTMQIFVKLLNCRTSTLTVQPGYTIAEIKILSLAEMGWFFTQPPDFYMSFQSRPLEDGRTLSDYNIQSESNLVMEGRARGGAAEAMEVDVDISTISDEDILVEFMRRDLISQMLPTIPDTSSPQVLI